MTPTKVIGDYSAASTIDGSTNYLLIQPGSSSTAYNKINRNVFLGVTGQPADLTSGQGFSNKVLDNTNVITVKDNLLTLQDGGDVTRQAQFQLSSITPGQTRIYTLPDATSTIANLTSTQTFTNKSLTSPAITGGTIDNSTITVDSIAGHTTANSGTIYGISVSSSKISGTSISNTSITSAQLANASVTPSKLDLGPQIASTMTSGTTTSSAFTATLAGSTAQTVTVTVGPNGILEVGIQGQLVNSTTALSAMSFALSGANTVAATNAHAVAVTGSSAMWLGNTFMLTGLTQGSTVVTMNFAVSGGTGTYAAQNLWALPL